MISQQYLEILRRFETKVARTLSNAPPSVEHHPGVIMTLLAEVELFVDDSLELLINTTNIESEPFGRELFKEHELSMYSSWKSRVRWLNAGFAVTLAGSHVSEQLDTLVELRNSFAHGGGGVTRFQRRDGLTKVLKREEQLAKVLNVQVSQHRFSLGSDTLSRSVGICRAYVVQMDSQIRLLPLQWRAA